MKDSVPLDRSLVKVLEEYQDVSGQLKVMEKRKTGLSNQLKAPLGEHEEENLTTVRLYAGNGLRRIYWILKGKQRSRRICQPVYRYKCLPHPVHCVLKGAGTMAVELKIRSLHADEIECRVGSIR